MPDLPDPTSSPSPQVLDLNVLLSSVRERPVRRSRLLRRRQWFVFLCLMLVPGTIIATVGFALYVRSDRYRSALTASLDARLGMFVEIGGVQPLGPRGRRITDLSARLTREGPPVFSCARALWEQDPRTADGRHLLTIDDGWILVGETRWTRSEYERMLTGGLGHRFDAVGVSEVRLRDIDIRFERGPLRFSAERASGVLLIEPDGTGRASIDCTRLNRVDTDRPVNVAARFIPGDRQRPRFQHIRLTVPTIPMSALNVNPATGSTLAHGHFAGTILYEPDHDTDTVTISGTIRDAELAELSTMLGGGLYHGRITVDVQQAVIVDSRLDRLDATGYVDHLNLRELVPALAADQDAPLAITIDQLRWRDRRLERLAASGQCGDLSLKTITRLIGRGAITGTAAVDVRSIMIVDDRLTFADATIHAVPPVDAPATISREFIGAVAEHWLGVNPAALLPEQIEYRQFGARVTIEDNRLRLRGTHGVDGKTILTVTWFDQPFGLLREPERTFVVPDLVSLLREQGQDVTREDLRELWERLRDRTTSEDE